MKPRRLWWLAGLLWLALAAPAVAQSLPPLPGVVNDYTGKLGNDGATVVAAKAGSVASGSHERINRLIVLFTPDLAGYTANSFGDAVFQANHLGKGDVILTVSFSPRAIIVTNSKELDSLFHRTAPDCTADWGAYVSTVMGPYLRAGNFADGANAGLDEIGKIVNQAQPNCQSSGGALPAAGVQGSPAQSGSTSSPLTTIIIIIVVVVVIVVLAMLLVAFVNSDGGTYYDDTPPYYGGGTYRRRRRSGGYGGGYSSPSYPWPSSSGSSSSSGGWGGSSGGSSGSSGFGGGGSSSSSSFGSSSSSSGGSSSSSGGW